MKFEALDTFKLIPISASWFAGIGLLEVLNPLGYTDMQYCTYGAIGATVGGLYSIAYLGGLAKGGNKAGLKKMAMVMALIFVVDAPVVRDKVIDVTVNPKYTKLKKEYMQIPKTENLNRLKQKLASAESSYSLEKLSAEEQNKGKIKASKEKAKQEYIAHYTEYGWWKNKAHEVGCSVSAGLGNNQLERERRIKCISNSYYSPIDSKKLSRLKLSITTLKTKISLAQNKNSQTINRENHLKKEIAKAEGQTLPMFAFYIIMFFIGWGFETFLPHLKWWQKWQNYDAQKKGKTVSQYQHVKQEESNQKLLEHTDRFLDVISTQKEAINWAKKVLGQDTKINAKIATFFAVIQAIKNNEEKLVISIVQNYSWLRNPKTNKRYNTQNHTTKIARLFNSYNITKQNMPITTMEEILKKVKNL